MDDDVYHSGDLAILRCRWLAPIAQPISPEGTTVCIQLIGCATVCTAMTSRCQPDDEALGLVMSVPEIKHNIQR